MKRGDCARCGSREAARCEVSSHSAGEEGLPKQGIRTECSLLTTLDALTMSTELFVAQNVVELGPG